MTRAAQRMIVGFDFSDGGRAALDDALALAAEHDTASVIIVHVVDQRALDETGALSLEDKKRKILDTVYRRIWAVVRDIEDHAPFGLPDAELDVQIRFAPGHVIGTDRKIAAHLLQAGADYECDSLVLGRRGRPGGVTDLLLGGRHVELRVFDGESERGDALVFGPSGPHFEVPREGPLKRD